MLINNSRSNDHELFIIIPFTQCKKTLIIKSMRHIVHSIQTRGALVLVYLANLFLSFHYFTTVYVNSSFIGNFLSEREISSIYVIASLFNIIIFLSATHFLRILGNYKFALTATLFDAIAVFGLAFTSEPSFVLPLFFLHQALVPIILFNLDIFLEHYSKNEAVTGELRAGFLTVMNVALVLSPLLLAFLGIVNSDYSRVYLLSGMFLMPMMFIIAISLRDFPDPTYKELNIKRELVRFKNDRNVTAVFICNFLLQLFYSFMVIYMPVYLNQYLGYSWAEIGTMLSIALLPFILFEFPIGALADKVWGEKEMMGIGFVIISVFLFFIPFIGNATFAIITSILFMTRVGAALIETTTESYFFKKINGQDADLVSLFRMNRPLSFVIGPLIGFSILSISSFVSIFAVLGAIMISGIYFVGQIQDTR